MHATLKSSVDRLLQGQDLSELEACNCVGAVMDGECDPIDIAAFLTAMAAKGPVPAELTGAATAMRQRALPIRTHRRPLLDTCGTGGDRLHTFNISTATAIVAAACGIPVAKHGNRGVSSSSGSADVLEALGVRITLAPADAGRCLDELGIAFCFAPLVHGAMKFAAPIRKQLGFPTIFNFLGPLTNPAGAEFQILGASSVARAELLAAALARLGGRRAFVVCGNDELDEVSLWGVTTVQDVHAGGVRLQQWTNDSFGLPGCRAEDLRVRSPAESAAVIRSVFDGHASPALHMVLANTAAALVVCEKVNDLPQGVALARTVISDGLAAELLTKLVHWTNAA
jgi:anthranilate phosphoribosyltransferase